MIKELLTKVGLILGSIIISLALVELILRLFLPPPQYVTIENLNESLDDKDPNRNVIIDAKVTPIVVYQTATGYRMRKNMNVIIHNEVLSKKDIFFSTNSLGFRGSDLPPKTADDYRILVMGDSITLADHVDFDKIYSTRLENYLNNLVQENSTYFSKIKSGLLSKKIQVFNGAIGGSDAKTQLAVLSEISPAIKPDLVIMGFYLNDANDSLILKVIYPPKIVRNIRLVNLIYSVYNKLRSEEQYYQFTNTNDAVTRKEIFLKNNLISDDDWMTNPSGMNKLIYDNYIDWGYAWDDKSAQRIKEVYTLIKEITDSQNIKLKVVMLPVKYQVQASYLNDIPQQNIKKVMSQLGIDFYDLLPDMRQRYALDGQNIFFDHCHLKPEGHEFVSKKIGDYVFKDTDEFF